MSATTTGRPRLQAEEDVFEEEEATPRPPSPARIPVEITAYSAEGYAVRVALELEASQIATACQRLQALGLSPTPPANTTAAHKPAQRATGGRSEKLAPHFNDDGAACCPVHGRPLKQGQWGYFCSAKDESTERGYCGYTWKG